MIKFAVFGNKIVSLTEKFILFNFMSIATGVAILPFECLYVRFFVDVYKNIYPGRIDDKTDTVSDTLSLRC